MSQPCTIFPQNTAPQAPDQAVPAHQEGEPGVLTVLDDNLQPLTREAEAAELVRDLAAAARNALAGPLTRERLLHVGLLVTAALKAMDAATTEGKGQP